MTNLPAATHPSPTRPTRTITVTARNHNPLARLRPADDPDTKPGRDRKASPAGPNIHPPAPARTAGPPAQPADHILLALADQFTAAGYDSRSPAWEDRGYLKITNTPGALSEVTISTSGHVTWEYRPNRPSRPDPVRLATVIAGLLDPGTHLIAPAEPRIHRALITAAGTALARHGLAVTLDVLDISHASCDVYCELRITNPARPDRGTVSLSSEGTIWWESRAQPAHTLDAIAASIVRVLADTAVPNWPQGTQHTACTTT